MRKMIRLTSKNGGDLYYNPGLELVYVRRQKPLFDETVEEHTQFAYFTQARLGFGKEMHYEHVKESPERVMELFGFKPGKPGLVARIMRKR